MDTLTGTGQPRGAGRTAETALGAGRLALLGAAILVPLLVAKQGGDFKAYAAQPLLAFCILALVPAVFLSGRISIRESLAFLPLLALWLSIWVSCLGNGLAALREAARETLFSTAMLSASCLLGIRALPRLASVWSLTLLGVSAYAVLQHFGMDPVEEFRRFHSRDRVFSTFGNPDFLGAHLAFMLPLSFWLALNRPSVPARILPLLPASLAILALIWTGSRGAWLGAAAGTVAWAYYSFPWRILAREGRRVLAGAAILLGLLVLSGHFPHESVFRHTDRPLLWKGTLEMIRQRPVFGWGWGSFPGEYPPFAPAEFAARMEKDNTFAEHPHSEYLNVAVERGFLGLGILAWLLAVVFRQALFLARSGETGGAAILGSLTAVLCHVAVDRNFPLASTSVPFWMACGLLFASPYPSCIPPGKRRRVIYAYATSLALAIMAAAWLLRPLSALYRIAAEPDFLNNRPLLTASELALRQAAAGNDPDFFFALGNAHAQEGDFPSAIESFRKACALVPDWPAALNNLGNCHFMLHQFPEAAAAYRRVLEIDPGHADARFNLAFTCYHQRDIKEALRQCMILLESNPRNAKALKLKERLSP